MIYSIEIILIIIIILFHFLNIFFKLYIPKENILLKKDYEISLVSMLSTLINNDFKEYLENYRLDLVYLVLSRLVGSYFSAFTFETTYYDEIIINSNVNKTDNVMFFYPLPYVFGNPLGMSKSIELLNQRLERQKIYVENDWWLTYVYDKNLSRNYSSVIEFVFPYQNYTIDNYSFFAFNKFGVPLKINNIYINFTNGTNVIHLNITNYYSPELFIVYRAVNNTTIKELEFLKGRYTIQFMSNGHIPSQINTMRSSWVTIYANLTLKKGANIFYIKYTYLPSYVHFYTNVNLKTNANSSYDVYIPKLRYFYYFPDISKVLPILDRSSTKYSDDVWLISENSIINVKVYVT